MVWVLLSGVLIWSFCGSYPLVSVVVVVCLFVCLFGFFFFFFFFFFCSLVSRLFLRLDFFVRGGEVGV